MRNGDDDSIEQLRRPVNYIQMAIGEGVKTARVNDRAHGPHFTTVTLDDEKENGV
jgi:hypothetical protein